MAIRFKGVITKPVISRPAVNTPGDITKRPRGSAQVLVRLNAVEIAKLDALAATLDVSRPDALRHLLEIH